MPVAAVPVQTVTPVQYWIIGAVIGSAVFVVLVCLLFVWRWKVGGPNKKISPEIVETVEMERKPVVCVFALL